MEIPLKEVLVIPGRLPLCQEPPAIVPEEVLDLEAQVAIEVQGPEVLEAHLAIEVRGPEVPEAHLAIEVQADLHDLQEA